MKWSCNLCTSALDALDALDLALGACSAHTDTEPFVSFRCCRTLSQSSFFAIAPLAATYTMSAPGMRLPIACSAALTCRLLKKKMPSTGE